MPVRYNVPGLSTMLETIGRVLGELGLIKLEDRLVPTYPLQDLTRYAFLEIGDTASIAAGSAAAIPLMTVRADERAWLLAVRLDRASGDNAFFGPVIEQPAGYRNGTATGLNTEANQIELFTRNTATGAVFRLEQPIPVEPGGRILVEMAGSGVGATVISFSMLLYKTKLIRAAAP